MDLTDLSPAALADLRRLLSYGLLPGRIAPMLNRMYGLELTYKDIRRLAKALKKSSSDAN